MCTSVNEVICHGIPDDRALRDGDIVNIDVTVFLDGVHGDTNATFLVGEVDAESRRLVRVTERVPRRRHRGRAIPARRCPRSAGPSRPTPTAEGFGVVRAFVGHGIGEQFHGRPADPALLRARG